MSATFDEATARRLHDDIGSDPEATREILEIFISSSATLVAELKEAARSNDARGVQRAAHTLGSSAGMLGAARLAEMARGLEAAAGTQARSLQADVAALADELARARPLLEAWAARLQPPSHQK